MNTIPPTINEVKMDNQIMDAPQNEQTHSQQNANSSPTPFGESISSSTLFKQESPSELSECPPPSPSCGSSADQIVSALFAIAEIGQIGRWMNELLDLHWAKVEEAKEEENWGKMDERLKEERKGHQEELRRINQVNPMVVVDI
jgi:hypothetical protein